MHKYTRTVALHIEQEEWLKVDCVGGCRCLTVSRLFPFVKYFVKEEDVLEEEDIVFYTYTGYNVMSHILCRVCTQVKLYGYSYCTGCDICIYFIIYM